MTKRKTDKDLDLYRSLLEPPAEFKDGFGWSTVIGILFCGLIMMPGGIYLGLMTGQGLGAAASWVTVILFMEIARRAMKPMSKQNMVVLLHAASFMMMGNLLFPGGPMGELVYRAYVAGSDAARDAGMGNVFPPWFVPPVDSPAIQDRNLLHSDWLVPITILAFLAVMQVVRRYSLGYFFFRLTSDVERLPFPLAPIAAQGAMALAESDGVKQEPDAAGDEKTGLKAPPEKKKTTRARIFSLGVTIGLCYGFIQVGIPAISGLFLSKPFFLIPQPYVDTTTLTETILPATPTGMVMDMGVIFMGFVLPFWSAIRDTARKMREIRKQKTTTGKREDVWAPPRKGRGDYPMWIAMVAYVITSILLVALCYVLLPKSLGILAFLIIFAFIYSPLISYVNARLMGISGQQVNIPFIRETCFLISGAKGVEIWLAPIPIENHGPMAQSYRVNELTGVSFWSLVKTDLVALPILLTLSLLLWGFIWKSTPIPSDVFPAARLNWELQAKNQVLLYSSTFVLPDENSDEKSIKDSEFWKKAVHPKVIGSGFAGCIAMYTLLSLFNMPIMLIYGMLRGLGALPHTMVLEIFGALIGRYYFQKNYGRTNFLKNAPALMAGYFTGVGLISMFTIALQLIRNAISVAPF